MAPSRTRGEWIRRNTPLLLAGGAFLMSGVALGAEAIDNQRERECFSSSTQVVVAEQAKPVAQRVVTYSYHFSEAESQGLRAELTEAQAVLESYASLKSCLDSGTAREVSQTSSLIAAALGVLQAGQAIPPPVPSPSPS